MPVKKTVGTKVAQPAAVPSTPSAAMCSCRSILCNMSCSQKNALVHKLFATLGIILFIYVIFLVGTMIRNNLKEYRSIGYADKAERTITLDAEGKVVVSPDIAQTTLGMVSEGATVSEAQNNNTRVMNDLLSRLDALAIEKADIQTSNYNIYPKYRYTEEEGSVIDGYSVNQSVTVKIRDLSKANSVLALAGEVGANSVSGLSFIVDDTEVYKAEAREKALQKIAEKAQALSQSLNVQLVSIAGYDEYEVGGGSPIYATREYALDSGYGGGIAPQVEAGSDEVTLNVRVTFEIR